MVYNFKVARSEMWVSTAKMLLEDRNFLYGYSETHLQINNSTATSNWY